MFEVLTETDGAGLYTYHFTNTSPDTAWAWGIPEWGTIQLQSHCVISAYGPPGWVVSVSSNGISTWRYTNGTYFIEGQGLTFVIQSAVTNAVAYTNSQSEFFPSGISLGGGYSNYVEYGVGFHRFSYIGPRPYPRFTAMSCADTQVMLSIEEMAGSTCFVRSSSNLLTNEWDSETNFPVAGIATNIAFPCESEPVHPRFYRLDFKN